jgi:tRNA threonylcarbamoyl adenosine modification protein YeaZ
MLILGLDTTQPLVQISLLGEAQKWLTSEHYLERMESLPALLKHLFEGLQFQPSDLSAIGFITGPGNYTSIRAGMMVVKTLTYRYQIPLYGLNKLEAALYSLRSLKQDLSPVFSVRQQQIYTGLGQWTDEGVIYQVEPHSTTEQDWRNYLESHPAQICKADHEILELSKTYLPLGNLAAAVAEYSFTRFKQNQAPETEVLPFYIRPAVQTSPK